jgi:uracil-DNA glycosylase
VNARSFVAELAAATIGETFNFYADGPGAEIRRTRLRRYVAARADTTLLLVGEAAGFRGARVSGIPFTSERQLTGGDPAESSATIVQRVLAALGIADETLLWNVVPTHPHEPGRPSTNRRPSRVEIEAAGRFLRPLVRGRLVVPVGRVAEAALGLTGVRHPSHGGAVAFEVGLRTILAQRAGREEW